MLISVSFWVDTSPCITVRRTEGCPAGLRVDPEAYPARRMEIGTAGDAWHAAGQEDWLHTAGMVPAPEEEMKP